QHCYLLDSGLYFDVTTVADYGRLARAVTDEGEGRIQPVDGKRNAADFAIWRKTPPGETRQMEWDSPWGKGAPGWHLECSVMSGDLLGFPFDIHTGGIDHREIHHPNEIAQNQAHCDSDASGANIWMHNNFLVERSGKMSKSSGEFLRLQLLIDRGYHPLAYRMMCLQAHYRSELEFSWEGLGAALVRLKRMTRRVEAVRARFGPEDPIYALFDRKIVDATYALQIEMIENSMGDDLNTPQALSQLEILTESKSKKPKLQMACLKYVDQMFGLELGHLRSVDLRIRPKSSTITEPEIDAILTQRKEARAAKDFATSDRLRDELTAHGVEVMDGDPLGWDWKLEV
ncbi:MAG: cysteine--tRNA ligase, partial [Pseudomonadota bacterium]|nr:cysteine--tRNA ligase [Pseudomonadota bacterium]